MDYIIGTITLFPYNYTPMGWALCNGQILSIAQYSAVFALVGTTYGGDGQTTFGIPNMQGLEPIPGMNYFFCLEGVFPQRD